MIFTPVYNSKGELELYDIYIEGKWIGSRNTITQCEMEVGILKFTTEYIYREDVCEADLENIRFSSWYKTAKKGDIYKKY